MKVAFLTLGCKVNKYEADLLKEKFEEKGHIIVPFESHADMYVISSCSVTNMSDRKTRQMISKAVKQNEKAIIAILGCGVESNKEDETAFDRANIMLGNHNKLDLLEVTEKYLKDNNKKQIKVEDISKVKRYKNAGCLNKGTDIRQAIKIEDGCNNFCSYCIIPYIRGRVRSRELEEIKKEATNLGKNGVRELVLVGIEVASYGMDLDGETLFDVLDILENTKGIYRVRLSSMEPRFLTENNIKELSGYTKLCPHFHLSMQSGNNGTLKRMNRKYTKEDLIVVCNNIRKYFKDPYLATDIIVGFPGETDEEFLDTIDTIEKMELTEIHVFKYSKRKYTVASRMDGQVDGNIKNTRSNVIINKSNESKTKYLEKYIGTKVQVLFENYKNGKLIGLTPNYMKVEVEGEEKLCGTVQDVVVISLKKDILQGNLD